MSVPQIPQRSTRMSASSGPTSGTGTSRSSNRPGAVSTAARIIAISFAPSRSLHRSHLAPVDGQRNGGDQHATKEDLLPLRRDFEIDHAGADHRDDQRA